MSTCAKCGNHIFRLEEVSPSGSRFKFYFIQCSTCGAPAGVVDYDHTGTMIDGLERRVNDLSSQIENLEHNISVLMQLLRSKH